MRIPRSFSLALVLAAAAPAVPDAASGQVGVPASRTMVFEPRFGVGYAANIPNQFAGVSVHLVTDFLGGTGVYVDAKFDTKSPEDEEGFIDTLTASQVDQTRGDQVFTTDGSWTSVNVALMKAIGPQFVVYGGAGLARGRQYVEFVDDERQMGRAGFYWVRDTEMDESGVNFLGGAMFQLTRSAAFQVGAESKPAGFTMGITYLVPLRR